MPASTTSPPLDLERLTLRCATVEDAPVLAAMLEAFAVEDGTGPGVFDTAKVLDHGFGADPAFRAIIAWNDAAALGYALVFPSYNTEIGGRGLWLQDIWVAPEARSRGIGRRLLAAVARLAREEGRVSVWWGVRNGNARGRAFYAALGAKDDDARILELDGVALAHLAEEA